MSQGNDDRFEALWSDYLEGELDEGGMTELQKLVASNDDLQQMAVDSFQLHRLLGVNAQMSESRDEVFIQQTMNQLPADADAFTESVMQTVQPRPARRPMSRWALPMAAAFLAAVGAFLYLSGDETQPEIATITGESDSLQWIGDGGRVIHDLHVGRKLTGGTISGMTPRSWFELEFNDGTTVMITGTSTLTFSEEDQKVLHLKEGKLSAYVKPQPAGKPMLVHTRNAVLEVIGTQFDVESDLATTVLKVNEGEVQMRRRSDGATVAVPAHHRTIAASGRDLEPVAISGAVGKWRSRLIAGPGETYGTWLPRSVGVSARLKAIPYTTQSGRTVYLTAFGVTQADRPPVILRDDSRVTVHGRIAKDTIVHFGTTLRDSSGAFAGRFQTARHLRMSDDGGVFELTIDPAEFALDPELLHKRAELPASAKDLIIESLWLHTLSTDAGLEVFDVTLSSSDATTSAAQSSVEGNSEWLTPSAHFNSNPL